MRWWEFPWYPMHSPSCLDFRICGKPIWWQGELFCWSTALILWLHITDIVRLYKIPLVSRGNLRNKGQRSAGYMYKKGVEGIWKKGEKKSGYLINLLSCIHACSQTVYLHHMHGMLIISILYKYPLIYFHYNVYIRANIQTVWYESFYNNLYFTRMLLL